MSLATILLGSSLALGAAKAPAVYHPETHTCSSYVERTAPQIIAEYQLGERNFDCTTIPKIKGRKVSVDSPERDFSKADLSHAFFRGSDLNHSAWVQTQLRGSNFDGADLSYSVLRPRGNPAEEAEPMGFSYARLRCAVLAGPFIGANFIEADLNCPGENYTSIYMGDFSHVDFTGARFDSDTYFPDSEKLQCVEMSDRDIKRLRSTGYEPQQRKAIIGRMDCPEE